MSESENEAIPPKVTAAPAARAFPFHILFDLSVFYTLRHGMRSLACGLYICMHTKTWATDGRMAYHEIGDFFIFSMFYSFIPTERREEGKNRRMSIESNQIKFNATKINHNLHLNLNST